MSTVRSLVVSLNAQVGSFTSQMQSAEKSLNTFKKSGTDLSDVGKGVSGVLQLMGVDGSQLAGVMNTVRAAQDAAGLASGAHALALKAASTAAGGLSTVLSAMTSPLALVAVGVAAAAVATYQYISATREAEKALEAENERKKSVYSTTQSLRDEYMKLTQTEERLLETKMMAAGATKGEIADAQLLASEIARVKEAKRQQSEEDKKMVESAKTLTSMMDTLYDENAKLSMSAEEYAGYKARLAGATKEESQVIMDQVRANEELKKSIEDKQKAEEAAAQAAQAQLGFMQRAQAMLEQATMSERERFILEGKRLGLSQQQLDTATKQFDIAEQAKEAQKSLTKTSESVKAPRNDATGGILSNASVMGIDFFKTNSGQDKMVQMQAKTNAKLDRLIANTQPKTMGRYSEGIA